MVSRYIHPVDGSNSNSGTIDNPWKDLSNLGSETWDEALIARDTQLLVTGKTILRDLGDKYIGAYGAGQEPVMSSYKLAQDWVEVLPNVWEFKVSDLWAPVKWLCFGQPGSYGTRVPYFRFLGQQVQTLPSADKEWDTKAPRGGPSVLCVYAPENPVLYYGAIYYQTAADPVFQIANADNITIEDITYQYASCCVKIANDDGRTHTGCKIINNKASDVSELAHISGESGWTDGFEVRGCVVDHCHDNGIVIWNQVKNGVVVHNQFSRTGLVESAGGIYVFECRAPNGQELIIKGNRIEKTKYGCYWPVDGAGIFVDYNSQNVHITQNAIFNSHVGMRSNSGMPGIRIYENITGHCDIGYEESDSNNHDSADTRVYYNNFLDCLLDEHYPYDPTSHPRLAAIRYFNQSQVAASYYFYSNEITGRGGIGITAANPINNYNNRFVGFDEATPSWLQP